MHRKTSHFAVKDFIGTEEDLVFAVVDGSIEAGRVLCFLRYLHTAQGWHKQTTEAANALLAANYPQYIYYSRQKDASLHAVPLTAIKQHWRPREVLQELLQKPARDTVLQDLQQLCALYSKTGLAMRNFGITGSVLIGAQRAGSDLDLAIYDHDTFQQARKITQQLLAAGKLQPLDASAWQEAYARRACALSLDEYVWHERRKFNKAIINGRKFDIGLVNADNPASSATYRKLGPIHLQARVKDAQYAFDYPALLLLEHPEITACVSFTATYAGQAEHGEWIAISGILEAADDGTRRIVVGSSREAPDEYIKVIKHHV